VGRFLNKDSWAGAMVYPQSLNGWNYVENRPILLVDPTGSFPWSPWDDPFWNGLTAGGAVDLAKAFWSKAGLVRVCFLHPNNGWWPTDTVNDLLTDWICEYGESSERTFDGSAHLTQQLARSYTIQRKRELFYELGGHFLAGQYKFDNTEFLLATIDSMLESDTVGFGESPMRVSLSLNVTHFLDSFDYRITRMPPGANYIAFQVTNVTDLESGTRIPPILGGVDIDQADDAFSIEELVEANPWLRLVPLSDLITHFPIISILKTKTPEETEGLLGLEGGGTMKQPFIWKEHYFECGLPPWPEVTHDLDIQ
jgi:hypothetical protein